MVEEIARSLQGLGFTVRIAGGTATQDATQRDQSTSSVEPPVLYVLCPRGRPTHAQLTALASIVEIKGGDDDDVYIAPVDVALPLRIVSILGRRASGSECPPIRRRWRESYAPARGSEAPTSRFPTVRSLSKAQDQATTRAWKTPPCSGVPHAVAPLSDVALPLVAEDSARTTDGTPHARPREPMRVRARGA